MPPFLSTHSFHWNFTHYHCLAFHSSCSFIPLVILFIPFATLFHTTVLVYLTLMMSYHPLQLGNCPIRWVKVEKEFPADLQAQLIIQQNCPGLSSLAPNINCPFPNQIIRLLLYYLSVVGDAFPNHSNYIQLLTVTNSLHSKIKTT